MFIKIYSNIKMQGESNFVENYQKLGLRGAIIFRVIFENYLPALHFKLESPQSWKLNKSHLVNAAERRCSFTRHALLGRIIMII